MIFLLACSTVVLFYSEPTNPIHCAWSHIHVVTLETGEKDAITPPNKMRCKAHTNRSGYSATHHVLTWANTHGAVPLKLLSMPCVSVMSAITGACVVSSGQR